MDTNHLNQQQLVELLYADREAPSAGDGISEEVRRERQRHLDACASCQANFDSLRRVTRLLDRYAIPASEREFDWSRVEDESASVERRKPAYWLPGRVFPGWLRYALAASAMLLVAALSFQLGRSNPANARLDELQREWRQVLDSRLAEFADSHHLEQLDPGELEQRLLDRTEQRLVKLRRQIQSANRHQPEWKQLVAEMAEEHRRLEEQLQTLAINAESEIADTRRKIDELARLTRQFLLVSQ